MGKVAPSDVYDYLVLRGVSRNHALGMLASIKGESNFDPGINEKRPTVAGSRGGFGLFQHTGPRRRALEAFAAERGRDVADWKVQIDFALTESDTKAYLNHDFATPETAAEWFVRHWERPADPDHGVRVRVAYLDGLREELL